MTDRRIGKIYNSVINNITKKIKTQTNCMKRVTNNPEHIYMLGNKCIKPDVKSRKRNGYRKITHNRMKKRRNKKSKRVKYSQRGGSSFPNVTNFINSVKAGVTEIPPPAGVLPWESHLTRNAPRI
jgi:hypothetical protein